MSNLVHWKSSPAFHGLFDEFFRGIEPSARSERQFDVRADVHESEKEYLLSFDLPGIAKSDVKIEYDRGLLSVSGERKNPKVDESGDLHFRERPFGRFTRAFRLPETVNSEKISAEFKEGVLTVSIPKTEAARPRTIQIAS